MNESLFSEPPVTPVMKCPSCGETLIYGVQLCRYCKQPIDKESARRSAIYLTSITRACSLANSIRAARPAILLFAVGGTMIYLLNYGLGYAIYMMFATLGGCGAVVRWRWKYGDIEIPDAEFTEARQMMKRELHIWLGLIAVEIFVLVVRWRHLLPIADRW